MKNFKLLFFAVTIALLGCGCSSDDDDPVFELPGKAAFLQEALSVSYTAGEAVARMEWSDTSWEVVMDTDNGIISNISPSTGGGEGSGKQYGQIKLRYNENVTEETRSQEVFLVNKKNGERSKLTLT